MNAFRVGDVFTVAKKNKYEKLPVKLGKYIVIHDGYFDGEKYWTEGHSPIAKCVRLQDQYTIEDKVFTFDKKVLEELEKGGYLKYE